MPSNSSLDCTLVKSSCSFDCAIFTERNTHPLLHGIRHRAPNFWEGRESRESYLITRIVIFDYQDYDENTGIGYFPTKQLPAIVNKTKSANPGNNAMNIPRIEHANYSPKLSDHSRHWSFPILSTTYI